MQVEEFGWRVYVTGHPIRAQSYAKSEPLWSPRIHARSGFIAHLRRIAMLNVSFDRVNTFIDNHWSRSQFVARPLSDRWQGKLQPILAINSSRLLIAAGNLIYSYGFGSSENALNVAPEVFLEATYSTSDVTHPKSDITSLICIPECGDDYTVLVGYANGTIEKLVLPPSNGARETTYVPASAREALTGHGDVVIESLSASSTHVLSFAASGTATFRSLFPSLEEADLEAANSTTIALNTRGWSSLLSTRSSRPYAAFGTSSVRPLALHDVLPDGISVDPFCLLEGSANTTTAVYDIISAPIASPWGSSDQIIISGWYDGVVRVHDLRNPSYTNSDNLSSSALPTLEPTLSFEDPWSYEPIYSISCGGGSGAHIAAGSARHSVVAFWDTRFARKGWSVHAPGNDSSPVYSVIVDGPRVFGANQSRSFVLDFGPGVKEGTYPAVDVNGIPQPNTRRRETTFGRRRGSAPGGNEDGLTRTEGPGFYVTKYSHARANWTGKSL